MPPSPKTFSLTQLSLSLSLSTLVSLIYLRISVKFKRNKALTREPLFPQKKEVSSIVNTFQFTVQFKPYFNSVLL